MEVGQVKEIRRYPVKSMGGELLEEVELALRGLPGDRAWALRDEVRGGIRGGKKIPGLMSLRSRYAKEPAPAGSSPAEVILPGGRTISTGDADAGERITQAINHSVTLWPLLPADALDHYRRGAPAHEDMEEELREIFGRQPDEPLPDLAVFPPELIEFESPPGTYFDAFPLLLMTESSLRSMQEKAPGSNFDVRRFRPNFLVADSRSTAEFPEAEWAGRRMQIGDAVLQIEVLCPRCVMTTHGFEDLPKDPKVMRALVAESGGNLGVYASVEKTGRVRTGDSLALLE